jgi:hypothetical protein
MIHLATAAIVAPFAVLYLTRTVTGEPLSAVILTLLLFVIVTALFTGAAPASPSGRRGARP